MKPANWLIILALAILTLMASAHAQSPREGSSQVAEQLLEWKGQYGGSIDAEQRVVVDANGWTRLWRSLGQDTPLLDFTKYFAVAVMAGERPTGGYTIEFLEPVTKGMDVTVRYRVKTPTGFTTQAIAQPWKVRAFPRVAGKVHIENFTKVAAVTTSPAPQIWSAYRGDREVLRFKDGSGPLRSTALLPFGVEPPTHPFLTASALTPEDEDGLRDILDASKSFPDFIERLKKAGYAVRPGQVPP
jgi:hypothetical protein